MKEKKIEAVDLGSGGLFVYQNKNGYTLSSDAVLLSNYIKCKKTDTLVDLCSGSGIVGILASIKNNPKTTYLVEIQESMHYMQRDTIRDNGYNGIVPILHDAKDLSDTFNAGSIDVVSVNPPYFKKGEGKLSTSDEINVARHELLISLEDIIKESSRLLKNNGSFYMINRTTRLLETIELLKKYNLGIKDITLVFPKNKHESNVFMVHGVKNFKGKETFNYLLN